MLPQTLHVYDDIANSSGADRSAKRIAASNLYDNTKTSQAPTDDSSGSPHVYHDALNHNVHSAPVLTDSSRLHASKAYQETVLASKTLASADAASHSDGSGYYSLSPSRQVFTLVHANFLLWILIAS